MIAIHTTSQRIIFQSEEHKAKTLQVYENPYGFTFRLVRGNRIILHSGSTIYSTYAAAKNASQCVLVTAKDPLNYLIKASNRGSYFFTIYKDERQNEIAKSGEYDSIKQANQAIANLICHLKKQKM